MQSHPGPACVSSKNVVIYSDNNNGSSIADEGDKNDKNSKNTTSWSTNLKPTILDFSESGAFYPNRNLPPESVRVGRCLRTQHHVPATQSVKPASPQASASLNVPSFQKLSITK